MRYMIGSSLLRIAGPRPQGLRVVFAAMAREADLAFDRMARASFLEGLLGYRPGALLKNPSQLTEAAEAITSGGENRIADVLLYERKMDPGEAARLLGDRDTRLQEALMAGVRQVVPSEGVRGLTSEGITNALAAGISPLTMDPYPAWKGGNIFWHTGHTAKGKVSMGSLASILTKRGKQKAIDILRGAQEQELGGYHLDAPIGDDEAGATLHDAVSGDSAISRADYIALYEAIFKSPSIMAAVDKVVKAELKGPGQERVWDAVKLNPHLITINRDGRVGIEKAALAKEVERLFGEPISGTAVRNTWVDKVWPAMLRAFKDSEVARRLLRKREVMEIIEEETRRRRHRTEKVKGIRRVDDPGEVHGLPSGFQGPPRYIKWAARRVASRYMKQSGHYGIKARWKSTEDGWVANYRGHKLEVWRSPYGGDLIIYVDNKKRGTKDGRGQGAVDFAKADAEELVERGMVASQKKARGRWSDQEIKPLKNLLWKTMKKFEGAVPSFNVWAGPVVTMEFYMRGDPSKVERDVKGWLMPRLEPFERKDSVPRVMSGGYGGKVDFIVREVKPISAPFPVEYWAPPISKVRIDIRLHEKLG